MYDIGKKYVRMFDRITAVNYKHWQFSGIRYQKKVNKLSIDQIA